MSALNENAITRVATVTGIDATAVASTELFAVPSGKTFIPDHVVIRCTSYTEGAKAIDAVASVGGNSTDYDDFLTATTIEIDAADIFVKLSDEMANKAIQAALDSVKLNIPIASDATTETWAVDLFGYLF